MKMVASNIDLILAEYPFLQPFVDRTLRRIKVSKIDLNLLRQVPFTWEYCDFPGMRTWGDDESANYHLVDLEGRVIATVLQNDISRHLENFNFFSLKTWFEKVPEREDIEGERVGDALERLDDTDKVVYIVEIRYHKDGSNWLDKHYGPATGITLHKLPKSFTMSAHVANLQREVVVD